MARWLVVIALVVSGMPNEALVAFAAESGALDVSAEADISSVEAIMPRLRVHVRDADAQGSDSDVSDVDTMELADETAIIVLPEPDSREGYEFVGYSTTRDGSDEVMHEADGTDCVVRKCVTAKAGDKVSANGVISVDETGKGSVTPVSDFLKTEGTEDGGSSDLVLWRIWRPSKTSVDDGVAKSGPAEADQTDSNASGNQAPMPQADVVDVSATEPLDGMDASATSGSDVAGTSSERKTEPKETSDFEVSVDGARICLRSEATGDKLDDAKVQVSERGVETEFDVDESGSAELVRKVAYDASCVTASGETLPVDVVSIDDMSDSVAVVDEDAEASVSFTVEFRYEGSLFVIEGMSQVPLASVLRAVGIRGTPASADDVTVSNSNLFHVFDDGGTLMLGTKQAFKSNEWLLVRIDGKEHLVAVTDAAFVRGGGMDDGVYWWMDDEGGLHVRNNSAVETGYFRKNYASAEAWPWDAYRGEIRTISVTGDVRAYYDKSLVGMFSNCPNLVSVSLDGLDTSLAANLSNFFANCPKLGSVDCSKISVNRAQNVSSMFRGCEALTSLDLSSWTNSGRMFNMQNLCRDCSSLQSFTLDNPAFVTRTNDGCLVNDMFAGANALASVDLSNVTIGGRADRTGEFAMLFAYKPSLTTVSLHNTKVPGMHDFNSMFEGCAMLSSVDLSGFVPSDATSMDRMFKDCAKLTSLDVSSFGKLEHIEDMYRFVEGCTSLATLDVSGLDNSAIGDEYGIGLTDGYSYDASRNKLVNDSPDGYRRELGLDTCTALSRLIAHDSKVWICAEKVSRYRGDTYWNVSEVDSYSHIMNDDMVFESDVGNGDSFVVNLREWSELVSDRYVPGMPDSATNTNMRYAGTHTNVAGAGFLPPGVWTASDAKNSYFGELPLSTYWVDHMDTSVPSLEFEVDGQWVPLTESGTEFEMGDYIVSKSGDNVKVYTRYQTFDEWGTGDFVYDGGKIRIVFPKAATGPDGTLHDVIVCVTGVTIKDVDKVPNAATYARRENDGNRVADGSYARYLLNVGKGYCELRNYLIDGNGRGSEETWQRFALSQGSGTYIDYDISIDGATEGETYVFWGRDLDVMYAQDWILDPVDASKDELPFENVIYGAGSEGVMLGNGNDLDTLMLASHTGLEVLDGNYVIPTGSDMSTEWSSFYVRADAERSSYTWTSGIACTSEIMLSSGGSEPETAVEVTKRTTRDAAGREFSMHMRVSDYSDGRNRVIDTLSAPGMVYNQQTGRYDFSLVDGETLHVDGFSRGWVVSVEEDATEGWKRVDHGGYGVVVGGTEVTRLEVVNVPVADTPLRIRKSDAADSSVSLKGVGIQVIDKASGRVVFEGVTDASGYVLPGHLDDGTYVLRETAAPYGYDVVDDIEFAVRNGFASVGGVQCVDNVIPVRDAEAKHEISITKRSGFRDDAFSFDVRLSARKVSSFYGIGVSQGDEMMSTYHLDDGGQVTVPVSSEDAYSLPNVLLSREMPIADGLRARRLVCAYTDSSGEWNYCADGVVWPDGHKSSAFVVVSEDSYPVRLVGSDAYDVSGSSPAKLVAGDVVSAAGTTWRVIENLDWSDDPSTHWLLEPADASVVAQAFETFVTLENSIPSIDGAEPRAEDMVEVSLFGRTFKVANLDGHGCLVTDDGWFLSDVDDGARNTFVFESTVYPDLSGIEGVEAVDASQGLWRVTVNTTGGVGTVSFGRYLRGASYWIREVDKPGWTLESVDGVVGSRRVFEELGVRNANHEFVNVRSDIMMPEAGSDGRFLLLAVVGGIVATVCVANASLRWGDEEGSEA